MKIITKEEIENRIRNKWPSQSFEIINYEAITKPFIIKCNNCGKIKKYSKCSNYLYSTRKGICSCYNNKNKETIHNDNKNKILERIKETNNIFISFGYKNSTKKYTVKIKCSKCEQIFEKSWQDYLKHSECPYCENKQKMNTEAFKKLISEEYELLSEYKGQNNKILIKHKCGFIWKINAKGFLSHVGCPKCNKKRSAGEQKIQTFLDENKIINQIEASFSWQSNLKRRYDFYLPEYNLIIEYMGEQHYKENSLFKISLKEQQEIDRIKKEECLKNGIDYLEICYKDFSIIEDILKNKIGSTTIRKEQT